MFCLCHCRAVYNIIIYWTALWRHPTAPWKSISFMQKTCVEKSKADLSKKCGKWSYLMSSTGTSHFDVIFSNTQACTNSLWPCDAICRHKTGSILDQVMACCLRVPSHYINQYSLLIDEILWHWLRTISQQVPKLLFCMMSLEIILLKLLPYFPRANELNKPIMGMFTRKALGFRGI